MPKARSSYAGMRCANPSHSKLGMLRSSRSTSCCDSASIIAQAVVPVHPDDDEARLSERILETEHRLYPLAVRLIAEGRVRIVAEQVEIMNARIPDMVALNPQDCRGNPLTSSPG